jgi:hypothetical protein
MRIAITVFTTLVLFASSAVAFESWESNPEPHLGKPVELRIGGVKLDKYNKEGEKKEGFLVYHIFPRLNPNKGPGNPIFEPNCYPLTDTVYVPLSKKEKFEEEFMVGANTHDSQHQNFIWLHAKTLKGILWEHGGRYIIVYR